MTEKSKYRVISPVRYDGKDYAINDEIELDLVTAEANPTLFAMEGEMSAETNAAGDENATRVKDALAAAQKLRDETQALADQAAKDRADAQVMYDEATAKLADALKASTDAENAAHQAAKDKVEAEAMLAEAKSEREASEKAVAAAKRVAKKN